MPRGITEEDVRTIAGPWESLRVLEARIEASSSTFLLKVNESPQLWPEKSTRTGIPLVIHDQVAKSPSRQFGVTRPAKGPARGLGGDHPGGDACFGPRRATNTPHKLPNENSAQIPRVWLISHRSSLF